jgi:hypothetical protein
VETRQTIDIVENVGDRRVIAISAWISTTH